MLQKTSVHHALSTGSMFIKINIAMHERFRKSLLECVALTVRMFCRHSLQHSSR